MAKNTKYSQFVNAVRARGGAKYLDLGGGVNLAAGVTPVPGVSTNTTQGGLIGALTPQSGFQAQLAPTTQLNYTPVVNQAANQALAGYNQYNQNLGNEQALAQQFINEGNGQGPNPAQAALAQNTGANIANQAALAAGQRGAASNVGLLERQVGQQGAATQQAAVGQGATLQAQQQLAAQQAAAAQQGQIGNQIQGQQGVNTNLFGTSAGAANTQNSNLVSNYSQANNTNAATAANNAKAGQGTAGGLLGGIGSAISSLFADGGEVGDVPQIDSQPSDPEGPSSFAGKFLSTFSGPNSFNVGASELGMGLGAALKGAFMPSSSVVPVSGQGATMGQPDLMMPSDTQMAAKGGEIHKKVPVMLSPGEKVLDPKKAKEVAKGKASVKEGKTVPGKAKVGGDSLKNDTVPDMLAEGSIVVPRHITQGQDPVNNAARFVQAVLAKKKVRGA